MGRGIIDTKLPEQTGCSRRRLLSWLWLGSLATLAGQSLVMISSYLLPKRAQEPAGRLFEMGPIAALPAVGDPPLAHPQGKFWLIHTEQGFVALANRCTHLDCLFSWDAQDALFICPCHGSRFHKNGLVHSGPAPRALDRFSVRIVTDAGAVLAETDLRQGLPIQVPRQAMGGKEAQSEPPLLIVDTSRKIAGLPVHG